MSGHDQHSGHAGGHETRDFDFGAMVWSVFLSLGILAVFLFVAVTWSTAAATREMLRKETAGIEEGREAADSLRVEESGILDTYGKGKDEKNARIPVRRAMEILAEEAESR